MPGSYAWLHRTWVFDDPVEKAPELLERLRGTSARLRERTRGLTTEQLTRRLVEEDEVGEPRETWSIQENVGHLWDLLDLEARRLEQYLRAEPALAAADMTNRKTWSADHNGRDIGELLDAFERDRARFVREVGALDRQTLERVAEHPRLKGPMRLVDMLRFFAEHDDYHVARITAIRRRLGVED